MNPDFHDDAPVQEPIEKGDIVVFMRFGNGVDSHLVGRLGLLLETDETRQSIYALDEDEPVHRRCVRVRADNGETVGARLDQLACWCNTGATLPEAVASLRVSEAVEEQERQRSGRTAAAKRVVDVLIKKLRQTSR